MANLPVEYEALYESASDILFDQDFSGRVIRANRSFERSLALSRYAVMDSPIYDRIAPELRDDYRQRILERLGGAPGLPFEIDMLGGTGRVRLELRIDLIFQNGSPVGVRCVGRDLSDSVVPGVDRTVTDLALLRQTESLATFSRYLQLLHRLSTTVYPCLEDLCTDYLTTGCQIFTLECGALVEFHSEGWSVCRSVGACGPNAVVSVIERLREHDETVVGSVSGATFVTGTPVLVGDQRFGALLFWSETSLGTHPQAREMIEMMARGIESAIQQRRLTEELEYRARHDSLTGLANRSSLAERLQAEIESAGANRHGVGVIFMDLDRFKEINDSLGHAVGDLALQEIARRFSTAADSGMLVARVGGDEFAAVVPGIRSAGDAARAAERLINALAEPLDLNGHWRTVTVSSGVALYPNDGESGSDLLMKADAAMYESKQSGGNRIRVAGVHAGQAG